MKKNIIFILSFIFLTSCSFDNKTGIWKDGSKVAVQDISELEINKSFPVSELEDVFPIPELYQEERIISYDTKIDLDLVVKNNNWLETYLTNGNNIANIFYKNNHNLVLKSSKLSKFSKSFYEKKKKIIKPLIYNNGLVSFDHKGTIYIYSTTNKKKIFEYNFYKKKFKKYEKYIYLAVGKEIIYAADNLGYIYALNIAKEEVIWAKNLGIPFRSNIKITGNYIFLANQDNILYALNKINGEIIWQFSTQPSFFKSNFLNNLALDDINQNIFFLNTSGELYSLNYNTRNVNWLLNFNKSAQSVENQIFQGVPIVTNDKNLIISNGIQLSNYNLTKNQIEWQQPISINIKPTITKNNIFLVTNNNFLICLKTSTGEIVWSRNIIKYIKEIKDRWNLNKVGYLQDLTIANNQILLFTSHGYIFSIKYSSGELIGMKKLSKSGFASIPIFSDGYLYILDKKYKLLKYE
jgi:outer membrane protein assembly factor BamB